MDRIGYAKFTANLDGKTCPRRAVGTCVIRALQALEGWNYNDLHDLILSLWPESLREDGACPCINVNGLVTSEVMREFGYERTFMEQNRKAMRYENGDIMRDSNGPIEYYTGRYKSVKNSAPTWGAHILVMVDHVAACIDGVVYDQFDSRRKQMSEYWTKTERSH